MKRSLLSLLIAGTLSTSVLAGDMKSENAWEKGAKDAWIDGKAEAILLFNGNLDAFDINTDVKNGEIILTGSVKTSVDKKLAEELVANIDGVASVNNKLTVMNERSVAETLSAAANDAGDEIDDMVAVAEKETEDSMSALTDAKIATVVKTRLLMDSDISGFDIDVDVNKGDVTLTGKVNSDAERQLAEEIAKNVSDVKGVRSNLTVTTKTAMKD